MLFKKLPPIHKEVLNLAIPNIISNISVPLLSAVDAVLMGRLPKPEYLGGIALAGIVFNFIYWGFGFLRMGTTGITAQAYGKNNRLIIQRVLLQAMLVAVVSSFCILLLQVPIHYFSFMLLHGSAAVEGIASEYFFIRIWAAPAVLGIYVLNGWFFGMQNARYPLIVTLVLNIINIIANVFFVVGLGKHADGVAMGTVIAQYVAFCIAVLLFAYSYSDYLKDLHRGVLGKWADFKNFMVINSDIFIRTMCLLFTFAWFTDRSALAGDVQLSANTILLEYFYIMAYDVDGFAYAAESMTGKYLGAGNKDYLGLAIKNNLRWGLGFAVLFSLFYLVAGDSLLLVFADNAEVIAAAKPYVPWLILIPLLATPAFIWDGVYIGTTATKAMRNNMILASFGVYLPFYLLASPYLGNHALWMAMALFMATRSIQLWYMAPKKVYGKI